MTVKATLFTLLLLSATSFRVIAQEGTLRTSFTVKYVAANAVYLNGGRDAGLSEGLHLTVKRLPPGGAEIAAEVVGEVIVTSLATTSAVCEIQSSQLDFQIGDTAYLSAQDVEALRLLYSSSNTHKYAQIVTFSEGDPLEDELREYIPRPPLPEVNRIRGRIGFEYSSIRDRGVPGSNSLQEGLILRADMTRIAGSYWNFTGYWRGRLNSRNNGPNQQTLTDLINRTYHIGLQYINPGSSWVAGFGRLLMPWASSLNTLDGGYVGRRFGQSTTIGMFGGSTPDPTAWNYNPDRQMFGTFVNLEKGSFERLRFSSTTGLAITRLRWKAERQFAFFENSLIFKRYFSVFHNLEADQLIKGRFGSLSSGPAVSRSFLTLRVQPHRMVSFDLNHNYFRNVPTFDSILIGTGLLDKLLFQGFSGGVRVELPYHAILYTSLGRSKRETDLKPSWNQMYGLTLGRLWRTGVRADFRYSQFDSAFGRGNYKSLSFLREINEKLRLELQAGQQDYDSSLTAQSSARWVNTSMDWFLTTHWVLGGGFTAFRGQVQNYDQFLGNFGYRF